MSPLRRLSLVPAVASCAANCYVIGDNERSPQLPKCRSTVHFPSASIVKISKHSLIVDGETYKNYTHVHIDRPRAGIPLPKGTVFGDLTGIVEKDKMKKERTKGTTLVAGVRGLGASLECDGGRVIYLSSHPAHLFHLRNHIPSEFLTTIPPPLQPLLKSLLKQHFKKQGASFSVINDSYVRYVVNQAPEMATVTGSEVEIEVKVGGETAAAALATSSSGGDPDAAKASSLRELNKKNPDSIDVYTASRNLPEVMHRLPCSNFLYSPLTSYPYGIPKPGIAGVVRLKNGAILKHNGLAIGLENVTIGREGVEITGEKVEIQEGVVGGCYFGGECGKDSDCYWACKEGTGTYFYTKQGIVHGCGVIGFRVEDNLREVIKAQVGKKIEDVDKFSTGKLKFRKGANKGRMVDESNGVGVVEGELLEERTRISEDVFMTAEDIRRWQVKSDMWWGSYQREVYGGREGRKDGWGKWLRR